MITDGYNVHIDDSIWNSTRSIREGIELALGLNEFAHCIQVVCHATNGMQSYEKSALIVQTATEDRSSPLIHRDAVGADIRGIIRTGNDKGRVWALALSADVEPGADGLAIACEIGMDNHGTFQPDPDYSNSKYAVLLVGGYNHGNQPATAVNYYVRGHAGHHRMHVMREDAFMGRHDDAFMAILYADTNNVKHEVGPNGFKMDGRRMVTKRVLAEDGSIVDAVVLE